MIDMMPKKYSPANNKLRSYLQGATKVSSGGLEAIFVWPSRWHTFSWYHFSFLTSGCFCCHDVRRLLNSRLQWLFQMPWLGWFSPLLREIKSVEIRATTMMNFLLAHRFLLQSQHLFVSLAASSVLMITSRASIVGDFPLPERASATLDEDFSAHVVMVPISSGLFLYSFSTTTT